MKSKEAENNKLTERQTFWLKHLNVCQEAGETLKNYAEQHGFCLATLYYWSRILRQRGHFKPKRPTRFRRITITQPQKESVFRIRLPNAVLIEWPGNGELSALEDILKTAARV